LVAIVANSSDAAIPFSLTAGQDAVACSTPAHAIQTYVLPSL
jgi:hypothetical protein